MGWALIMAACAAASTTWDFSDADEAAAWVANAHVAERAVLPRGLRLRCAGPDPILVRGGLDLATTSWQYAVLRLRASKPGVGELFWSATTGGPHGGFSADRAIPLPIAGTGDWEVVSVYPGWRREGTIRQLRLDLYDGAEFTLAALEVVDWSGGRPPITDPRAIPPDAWMRPAGSSLWFAPPLALEASGARFAAVTVEGAAAARSGALVWATSTGSHREAFPLAPGVINNIELRSAPGWEGTVEMLAVDAPDAAAVRVALADGPQGPPRVEWIHVGLEDGISRAGRSESVLVKARNVGGPPGGPGRLRLQADGPVRFESPDTFDVPEAAWGDPFSVRARVHADAPGLYPIRAEIAFDDAPPGAHAGTLRFLPSRGVTPVDYVPAPEPVATVRPVATYYFPGWATAAAWNPIRETAPGRKPALGYYDEALPEIVDWQIKWAREHGVEIFLVDWYWNLGAQHLAHWFEAYRKARYRDLLRVAIMWANHNPPGSHTHDDWVAVTRHWIADYFGLEGYLRIDGMPAVFLWDPRNFRADLGGSDGVRRALEASQAIAREAGYPGIHFATLHGHESAGEAAALAGEGFAAITSYHEWGDAPGRAASPREMRWEDVVETAPRAWAARHARAGGMRYYPVADTGWDSRPWHGDAAAVIHGRDVSGFRTLLRAARAFAERHDSPMVVLGPWNEWGEGSHIEPCATFGFAMLEAVRDTFASDAPHAWPESVGPRDLDLGPYDLPDPPRVTIWTFDTGAQGWAPMMNIGDWRVEAGRLVFTSTSPDPAMHLALAGVDAGDWPRLEFEMRITGKEQAGRHAQLFWSMAGRPTSEAASVRVPLAADGAWHAYRVSLAEHPRWRGRITALRFDPCESAGIQVELRRIALAP